MEPLTLLLIIAFPLCGLIGYYIKTKNQERIKLIKKEVNPDEVLIISEYQKQTNLKNGNNEKLFAIHGLVLMLFCLNLLCCKSPVENESMQPYSGYPLIENIDTIKQALASRCLDTIIFKRGEIIADVGAGNGYLEGMLSLFNDSLTFYIQDIDTSICNQRAVEKVVNFYKILKEGPYNCRFFVINGSDIESNLPDETFDKILILYTYQYFKYPKKFMTDLNHKLKPDGRLYIVNPDVDHESSDSLKSVNGWNASPIEEEINDILQCGFELISISRNYKIIDDTPYIMVFKLKNQKI